MEDEDMIGMDSFSHGLDGDSGGIQNEFFPKLIHLEDEDYSAENYFANGMETSAEHARHQAMVQREADMGQEDDDVYYERISMSELFDQCVIPTFSQAVNTVYPLLAFCVLSRIVNIFAAKAFANDANSRTLTSGALSVFGLIALHQFYQENMLFVVMLVILVYPLLSLTHCKCRGWSGISVSVVVLVYLLTCELVVVSQTDWHQIRGAQMILAMKIISLAFDLDSGATRELPGLIEYCGYVLHVGSVMFGPWTSYSDYSSTLSQPDQRLFDFYWVMKLCSSACLAVCCVLMSTCFCHWVLLETSFIWLVAFRDALSFRFSHYFVCYLSELTQTMSGLGGTRTPGGDTRWDMTTTRVLHIEFPRSLVEVVTSWNLPMHHWLKNYVFKNAKPLGNVTAIFITYAASSVLHGVNFQLSSVLLSLGFYTYVEYVLRKRLSESFSACIESRRCKPDCKHRYRSTHIYVILTNVGFGLLAVFHLTYLGLMFDSSAGEDEGYSMDHTLSKWSQLGFASHWVALATYIFYILV